MNKSKNKGDRFERAVCTKHKQMGFECERTLTGGARNTGGTWDLDLVLGEEILRLECKARRSGFKQIYDWLAGRDVLVVKEDRREPIYCMSESMWFSMLDRLERVRLKR